MSLQENNKLFLVFGSKLATYNRDQYASDNFPGTPRGSRKKPIAGTSPTGRLSTVALCRGVEKNGMVGARHGLGMASVNQTRPHCVNQMGKTHSEPLATRHERDTLCVNRPLLSFPAYVRSAPSRGVPIITPYFLISRSKYSRRHF